MDKSSSSSIDDSDDKDKWPGVRQPYKRYKNEYDMPASTARSKIKKLLKVNN